MCLNPAFIGQFATEKNVPVRLTARIDEDFFNTAAGVRLQEELPAFVGSQYVEVSRVF